MIPFHLLEFCFFWAICAIKRKNQLYSFCSQGTSCLFVLITSTIIVHIVPTHPTVLKTATRIETPNVVRKLGNTLGTVEGDFERFFYQDHVARNKTNAAQNVVTKKKSASFWSRLKTE
jgi:hypothetical protein